MPAGGTDRIEKQIVLKAPRYRVWRALTDAREFGAWFRVSLDGPFVVGGTVRGHILYPGYEHLPFEATVERMEPETFFSYRWPADPSLAGCAGVTTLVEFTLEDVDGGTKLTVVESGFDAYPPAHREAAFRGNEGGWEIQMSNVERHVAG